MILESTIGGACSMRVAIIGVVALLGSLTPAAAAEIKVFSTVAMSHVLEKLAPKFEADTGHKIVFAFGPSGAVAKRVANGEPGDVLLSTRENVDPLVRDGKLVGPTSAIATSSVGIAVKSGSPKPDISTPEALKATLLAARSLAFSNPAAGGASGIHFAKVIEQLGIAKDVMAKAKLLSGEPAAKYVANGDVELAVHQIPELKAVQGADIVGPLPPPLQAAINIIGAVLSNSSQAEAARAFLTFLTTPEAAAVIEGMGMSRASS